MGRHLGGLHRFIDDGEALFMSFLSSPWLAAAEVAAVSSDLGATGTVGFNLGGILLVIGLVLLNGFFVAAEFSIVKVRGSQLDQEIERGDPRARVAKELVQDLDAYLSATQLGITLASIALGVVAEPLFAAMLEPLFHQLGVTNPATIHTFAFAISFSVVTYLHVVVGELMPKSLAIRRSVQTALWIARPLQVFHFLFKPAIWVFNGTANKLLKWWFGVEPVSEADAKHSAEELAYLVNESDSNEVTDVEKEIMIRTLALNDRTVRDVMLPRRDVVYLDATKSFADNFHVAVESRHTRFPLVDGNLDEVIGIVHIKHLIMETEKPQPSLEAIHKPFDPIPERLRLDTLLKRFLQTRSHLGMVVDEYGRVIGMVTLDNVLEELVGDIHDEFDDEEAAAEALELVWVNSEAFEVEGGVALHDLAEDTDLDLSDPDVATVGGYITSLMGHLPKVGETVDIEGYEATILAANGLWVEKVRFERKPTAVEPDHKSRVPA